jgi:ketosteroid isomerase-like protein
MSAQNVEALRGVYERWSEGDFKAGVDLFDPRIMFVIGQGFPEEGTYVGRGEVREYMRGFLEPWVRITIEAEELIEVGDSVVAAVLQSGAGSGSGVRTEFRYFQVWTFRGDRVVRFETFRERDDALTAVGRPRCPPPPAP